MTQDNPHAHNGYDYSRIVRDSMRRAGISFAGRRCGGGDCDNNTTGVMGHPMSLCFIDPRVIKIRNEASSCP